MEVLDNLTEESTARRVLTTFGKAFYGIEVALWALTILMLVLMPLFVLFGFAAILLFYLLLGPFFPFVSGAFVYSFDKVAVLAGLLSIPVFMVGAWFQFHSWPYSSAILLVSFVVSLAVFVYLLGRLISVGDNGFLSKLEFGPYDELATKHLRYMLIRMLPLLLVTASMTLKALV